MKSSQVVWAEKASQGVNLVFSNLLVGVEVQGQLGVVALDDDASRALDGLGAHTSLKEDRRGKGGARKKEAFEEGVSQRSG